MAEVGSIRNDSGVAFLVSAGLVYETIAAACSSPQTAEINAHARAGTLMKWVYIGVAQAVLLVAIGAVFSQHRFAVLSGGTLAAMLMLAQYHYARAAGLQSNAPGTESYQ